MTSVTIPVSWYQKIITLKDCKRGCYVITDEVVGSIPEIKNIRIGLLNILLDSSILELFCDSLTVKHTSASLALNESWDPEVRQDTEKFLNHLVPESFPFKHTIEGPDDMPAHLKCCFLGTSLNIPVTDGQLNLGQWQGIWLCEHRNNKHSRQLVLTLQGSTK